MPIIGLCIFVLGVIFGFYIEYTIHKNNKDDKLKKLKQILRKRYKQIPNEPPKTEKERLQNIHDLTTNVTLNEIIVEITKLMQEE